MPVKTNRVHLDQSLTFSNSDGSTLTAQALELILITEGERLLEGRLALQVNIGGYAQIDRAQLFHLAPEVRGQNFSGKFDSAKPVELELGLRTTLLPALVSQGNQPNQAGAYLFSLKPTEALRQSQNWYALNVKQAQGDLKAGYATKWSEDGSPARLEPGVSNTLFESMLAFFKSIEWPINLTQNPSRVQIDYEGDNANWQCFAEVQEDNSHFAFYSVCPQSAPEEKRAAVAEFLSRANYGLLLGNFEMDYNDGEVRYRTSIIVDNNEDLSLVINHLVYANVGIMDQYVVALVVLLNEDVTAEQAIALAESPESWERLRLKVITYGRKGRKLLPVPAQAALHFTRLGSW